MNSVRSFYASGKRVLQQHHISSVVRFESKCQYHQIKLHQYQILSSCLNKHNVSRSSINILLSSRHISTNNIDSVESQDEKVTQLYSQNIEKLSETNVVTPTDKSSITSPEITDVPVDVIPESPAAKLAEILEELSKEPSITELGLGGWWPTGIVQQWLEYMHIGLELPWWQCIMIATLCVRLAMFPLTVYSQKNTAKMSNAMPEMQRIQLKMTEARNSGDHFEAARSGHELMKLMKDKNVNPIKSMIVPLLQAPVFLSFFLGLRGMANVPVDSMKEGGILWFVDLTLPDQFYILPIFTSLTLLASLEFGGEVVAANPNPSAKYTKYILRALPIVIFPFTLNFPGAICLYWSTSNFITLCQVFILKIPAVRETFKIPKRNPPPAIDSVFKKGFVAEIKESMKNSKISKEIADRMVLDEMQFNKAGKAALVKTYKFNPTLQKVKSTDSPTATSGATTPSTTSTKK